MTALVVLDARQNLNQTLTIDQNDRDNIKHTYSRVRMAPRSAAVTPCICADVLREIAWPRRLPATTRGSPGLHPRHEQQGQTARHATPATYDSTGLSTRNVSTAQDSQPSSLRPIDSR